jgi:large subunit ribosomal protein L30
MSDKIKVKLTRSLIGSSSKQRKVAQALGFKKRDQVVEHYDTPIIRGMVNKISHLLTVEQN